MKFKCPIRKRRVNMNNCKVCFWRTHGYCSPKTVTEIINSDLKYVEIIIINGKRICVKGLKAPP